MAQVSVTVCDVCGGMEGVKHVTVSVEGEEIIELDLCEGDRSPLRSLGNRARTVTPARASASARRAPSKRTTTRRSPLTKVTSMEEIAASKKGGK